MRFAQPVPITEIASLIGAQLIGNTNGAATGINEIHKVELGDLVFVDHPKYYQKCIQSDATYIIINEATDFPEHKALLLVDQPFEAYLSIVNHFQPVQPVTSVMGVGSSAGAGTTIMHGAVIGNNVQIGDNCTIYPNAVIMDHTVIGNNVIIQSGTVIGSDAFYYNKKTNRPVYFKKMQSCGRVVLEDFVEIGANCTIDRGVTADTVIGAGTKIDNLVHVGHDVAIGKNCLIAAQVGIAGATVLEDEVILWGQVGVNKTITIGKGAEVMGQSGVTNTLAPGGKYFGLPAEPAMNKKRESVWVKRIPELWEKVMKG
ncbi:UDP-3-O-[3-hydroxymyristoyl] glucosamine N-acyltransferase [Cnuella takakiae]|uniref:UDP-3-O-[3-hydroxymyristoyl] glucosamine N-acyltransferase n=1 Tax=Cnuella takakiae TaxID=1302690 RepID=A0A1M5ISD8_9BACT|nr:UDP-3-O-(3-hydroxymyristoyl)glucosamine N-acyltransferase [Cnuella takakiae]OLY94987.1 UDP-3-O-(3-hydroxymyristoyl)glucosamine N-acyltransferase [Cnuella takakiae]SHG30919.1 UDP-3-O-[3-hydroxymyristoyl] glucosamine N-acyltransferase [Cnuella takakiae]